MLTRRRSAPHPPLVGFVLGLALVLLVGVAGPPAGAAQPEPGPPPAAGVAGLNRREICGYGGSTFVVNGYR